MKHKIGLNQERYLVSETIRSEFLIPTSIFNTTNLTTFEALVKYLKEERELSYKDIGVCLDRDERNIWTVYNRAIAKISEDTKDKAVEFLVPSFIFVDNTLTPFEALVEYLKEQMGLNYRIIGKVLSRDERNIWTIYKRVKIKREHEKRLEEPR